MNQLKTAGHPDATPALADESYVADCVKCGAEQADYRFWQTLEANCVTEHWSIHCPDCGFADTDTGPPSLNREILTA